MSRYSELQDYPSLLDITKMLLKKKPFPEILFLLIISAIVYLPNIGKLTYFKDDWYYIYDGLKAGAKIFHEMFSIDRPARGFFFEAYYSLFGPLALPYHINAFVWRWLSAIGALWIFNILWPRDRRFAFFTTLLFAIYPGYYWWISAIEYQPMIASLAFQVFSIAFTLKAVQSSDRISKIGYLTGAIITGWIYIALVDYAIGMEAFRFFCVYILLNRNRQYAFRTKIVETFKAWAWNILIPFGYIIWQTFFFTNQRKATDISLQLSKLFNAPLSTLAYWFLHLFNSIMNLSILAWVNQFPRFFFGMPLREAASGLLLAGFVILLVLFFGRLLNQENDTVSEASGISNAEALKISIPSMVLGIMPIIMANRIINLNVYSHYSLPASLAAAVFLSGFIYTLSSKRAQSIMIYSIIVFAVLAHYGISITALNEERAIDKFWWQVSWRIPALRPGATLAIHYPSENIGDDGNGVMEAANMIYFPNPSDQIPVQYNVAALTLGDANIQDILVGKLSRRIVYRSHAVNYNYGNILVLSQPTPSSCVHVIDGSRPLISTFDPANVMLAASLSNIENIMQSDTPFVPQNFAFGNEPEHSWCYFYEKAELALQFRDWNEISTLGEEAIRLGLHPIDRSEWLPFLYGYAMTGNDLRIKQTSSKINDDTFLRLQTCEMFTSIKDSMPPEIWELTDTLYCKGK
jgi:hypothetical protein